MVQAERERLETKEDVSIKYFGVSELSMLSDEEIEEFVLKRFGPNSMFNRQLIRDICELQLKRTVEQLKGE